MFAMPLEQENFDSGLRLGFTLNKRKCEHYYIVVENDQMCKLFELPSFNLRKNDSYVPKI